MEIHFKTKKLQKQLSDPVQMQRAYGGLSRKINQRIEELKAADNLAIMISIPAARCHELEGKRSGELAVDVSGNCRLVFEPFHNPVPEKEDGGLDWERVLKVQINKIEDYH